ncbi:MULTISPECIES: maleylacetoacetate isomerase [unclassified Herbaspirillum]|uniref:maleylacetoacetate isomerase n=1 Tax=unclassified Herbaspirillum TaxID=2624150 RepID=UPI000E2FAEB8|nr:MULTISPECIES: maleylacetoacetate isomerase [unclassified Herbaspirillum]RFB65631.1 maleylacetoacetate isomerase [Herbaspirillum sp. 3R-3a1]TFI09065.1 maleylacetoacetate isomerase [Herbaspirillum sp. 3R11]TFI15483.1 maleylacetoacetate isomerase [Herbaspirillum sp. 3R-11]TFI31745.1 maleylacetoacetate isomerase [Herbaspirillum sp. 3C11]
MTIHLYSYFRSSASYRVRIALHLKGQSYDTVPVHLLNNGGEQYAPAFSALNPQSLVPVMEEEGRHITQSLAILEYLEERFPTPALLPPGLLDRAHVREISLAIACDIHPLNNLRVLRMLKQELGVTEEVKQQWIQHWIALGFGALEKQLAASTQRGRFCFGDTPTMADCCLIPQIFNARRFNVDMMRYPTLAAIEEACNGLEAFQLAQPSAQPDAA